MRVGIITYGLDRSPTGIGRYTVTLIRALAALPAGPEIVLLTTESHDPHGLWREFEHHALPGCRLLPALMTIGNAACRWAARRYRLDLIHDPNGVAPFLLLGRTPSVVTIHDAVSYVYPAAHNRLDNWRYHWLLPQAIRRTTAVLTDSQHSAHDLGRYLAVPAAKLQVVYPALDAGWQPVAPGPARAATLARYGVTAPYLLYVGALNARKNIARLLESFALARAAFPCYQLVIAGQRQWQTAAIDAAFARFELGPHVHFTGYVADGDLSALYSGAAAFVFPSLYEGFGLPPLEAMACGVPVIASNVASLPEAVGDAALLVDPTDVAALAAALTRLLTSAPLQAELRARGFGQAARFPPAAMAEQVLAVYRRILGAPSW